MTYGHDDEEQAGTGPDEPEDKVTEEELEVHPDTIIDLTVPDPGEADAVRGGRHYETCDAGMTCKPG